MSSIFTNIEPCILTDIISKLDSEQLTDLANMYGIESVVIDKNTDIKEFEKELKWNDLYWRLNK